MQLQNIREWHDVKEYGVMIYGTTSETLLQTRDKNFQNLH